MTEWFNEPKYRESLQKLKDPCWFFEHMLVLRYNKGKPQFFKLTEMQRAVLEHVKKELDAGRPLRVVLLKGRRIGYSTLMAGLLLWNCTVRMIEDGSDKDWDIVSASYLQATMLFQTTKKMVEFNPFLLNSVEQNRQGPRIYSDKVFFKSPDGVLSSTVSALASGGATKRGRSPDGIVWDEAAQVKDEDYADLSISSLSGDNHEIIGSTPYDDAGWFFDKATDERQGYTLFTFPMAELNDEGQFILNQGEHRKLEPKHITKVHGCKKSGGHMSPKEVCDYLQTVDLLTARREVFAEFVSGLELYYSAKTIKNCMFDYMPLNIYKASKPEIDVELNQYSRFKIGIDWAGGGAHKTCLSIFGQHIETNTWAEVYWESWTRTRYNDQWKRVKHIYELFADNGRKVEIYCDSTGTQDTNVDALQGMNVPAIGVNFSISEKTNMARNLFELMHREQIRFGWTHDKFTELTAVDVRLKGEGGHLGDWVAAIWCAIKSITVYKRGKTSISTSGSRQNAMNSGRKFSMGRGQLRNI